MIVPSAAIMSVAVKFSANATVTPLSLITSRANVSILVSSATESYLKPESVALVYSTGLRASASMASLAILNRPRIGIENVLISDTSLHLIVAIKVTVVSSSGIVTTPVSVSTLELSEVHSILVFPLLPVFGRVIFCPLV